MQLSEKKNEKPFLYILSGCFSVLPVIIIQCYGVPRDVTSENRVVYTQQPIKVFTQCR